MDIGLNETQQMLKASAREFLAESCPSKAIREMRSLPGGFARALWQAMAGLGWPGLALPESSGGSGMQFLELCLLIEELGYACVPSPFLSVTAGAGLLLASASGNNTRDLLQGITIGESIALPAFDGCDDGDGRPALPRIRRDAGRYVINGTHSFVPFAQSASHFLCRAVTGSDAADEMLFAVRADTPGLALAPLSSWRDEPLCRLELTEVRLTEEELIASGERAAQLMRSAVNRMDAARCFDIVGALSWVLNDTVSYATDRKQFGQPIGSFQVIQHYCADMHVMLEGLRMAALNAGWRLSEGLDSDREVALVCAYAHSVVPRFMALAHQIHGAMGVTIEHDLHLYTTRVHAPGRRFAPLSEYLEAVLTM